MSGYIGSNPYNRTARTVESFVLVSGQTSVSFQYTPGLLDVFYNGVLLDPSDYTATDGTSIVLSVGANNDNDILTCIAYTTFTVANHLQISQNLSDVADAATARSNLGLGTAAVKNTGVSSGDIPTNSDLPLSGYIHGLTLSNNSVDAANDIDIASGVARDSSDVYTMRLSAGLTKQLDAAWAAGTNVGGLFSGVKAADTWYHVFLIRNDTDGSIDAGFDTSMTAANIPAGYSSYRRIGSVLTDASSNIIAFHQMGRYFFFDSPIEDVSAASSSDLTEYTVTVSVPPNQLGIFIASAIGTTANVGTIAVYSADLTRTYSVWSNMDVVSGAADSAKNASYRGSRVMVPVNASSQIKYQTHEEPAGTSTMYLNTLGWKEID